MAIDGELVEDVAKIFQWLTHSFRPMQLREVADVAAFDVRDGVQFNIDHRFPEPRDALKVCSSLVTTSDLSSKPCAPDDKEIRLAHLSVKEYLVSVSIRESKAARFYAAPDSSHISIAKMCLAYLLQFTKSDMFMNTHQTRKQSPLAEYSALYWTQHVASASDGSYSDDLIDMITALFDLEGHVFWNWLGLSEGLSRVKDFKGFGTQPPHLYYAAKRGVSHAVQYLVEKGMDVNAKHGRLNNSALQAASLHGHRQIVQLLLRNGAIVDAEDGDHANALYLASSNGHCDIINELVNAGANVNAQGELLGNALCAATTNSYSGAVRLLLASGANVDQEGVNKNTPLHIATSNGFLEEARLLLDFGAAIERRNDNGMTPLVVSAKSNRKSAARLLLEKGANLEAQDTRGHTPLLWSAKRGNKELVEFFIEKGAALDVRDEQNHTPYLWALKRDHTTIVHILGRLSPSLDAEHLWWALKTQGGDELVAYTKLLHIINDASTDINARDEGGRTLLSRAAEVGHEELTLALLDRGACLETLDEQHHTPLLWAAKRGHEHIVRALINRGAKVDVRDSWWKQTALSWAAKRNHGDVVRLLLEHGTDLDAVDKESQTALMWSAKRGHEAIVHLLIRYGADATRVSASGETAVTLARKARFEAVARLLQSDEQAGSS